MNFPEDVFITQPAYFIADQAVGNIDLIANSKDTLVRSSITTSTIPRVAPFGYSAFEGFTQHLDAGSQVASITNTQTLTPNLNVAETFGFIREKIYSTIGQPFTPAGLAAFGARFPNSRGSRQRISPLTPSAPRPFRA